MPDRSPTNRIPMVRDGGWFTDVRGQEDDGAKGYREPE
jgi:hypothetical protein